MALSAARLRLLFHYDPETGIFTRRVTRGSMKAGQVAGSKDVLGYLKVMIDERFYYLHRLAWLYVYGRLPKGDLDHIDEDKGNNRIRNLRPATRGQNMVNVSRWRHNTSGFKGVHFHAAAKRYEAYASHQGRKIYLGLFDTPEGAYAARSAKMRELHGPYYTG